MAHIVVLATGGTIASTRGSSPGATATEGIASLLQEVDPAGHTVTGRDILTTGSYLLTHRDLRLIAESVTATLQEADVDGVVLTHGTDTLEETAYLLDLIHDSDKPVVLTGAQRTPDSIGYDGTVNLLDAITVAASESARGAGVLIVFASGIHPARGTRKLDTIDPSPFGGAGPLGFVHGENLSFHARPRRRTPLPLPAENFDGTRVDVLVSHPGADATLARAAVAAGARGIVLVGTGAGNGNHAIRDWVAEAVVEGVTVGVSSRTTTGPVLPLYGNGGTSDLLTSGAVSLGELPWPQARILLAQLISTDTTITPSVVADHI